MAGIYLHIPFCKQACYYCNFHFSTSLLQKEKMISALIREIELIENDIFFEKIYTSEINTIYFGGGTPSLLKAEEIKSLLYAITNKYQVSDAAEITLEANPDDISKGKLNEWKDAGINRLSIGIQSFKNEDLAWMNRAHDSSQSFHSIEMIKNAGYENFSVDLIYGTPLLSDDEWKRNVDEIIEMKIPHVSCYALTVEPATALKKMIEQKKKSDIDPEKQARQFLVLIDWMKKAGYEHYEISNFCLPGYRSKHNSSYWQGKPYIGIGPSAHSFNGNSRRWNVSNNALYVQSIFQNVISFEEEKLSVIQQLNEYIMTSLRTIEGMDLNFINEKFGKKYYNKLQIEILKYLKNSNLIMENSAIILTDNGKLFADGIAADLFFKEEL